MQKAKQQTAQKWLNSSQTHSQKHTKLNENKKKQKTKQCELMKSNTA